MEENRPENENPPQEIPHAQTMNDHAIKPAYAGERIPETRKLRT